MSVYLVNKYVFMSRNQCTNKSPTAKLTEENTIIRNYKWHNYGQSHLKTRVQLRKLMHICHTCEQCMHLQISQLI